METNPSTEAPKVFISYSWAPPTNKEFTLRLAERLSNDGVHVIIDVWDLSEGQDKYVFMEQMVNRSDLKRVLLICNKEYADKANGRTGGVGSETVIVSNEVYSKVDQKKFIPVIAQKDEHGKPFVPTYIQSKIYIDLSDTINFETEYQKLVRNIFDKPEFKRPPIGSPPTYIQAAEPVFLPTAHKVSAIKDALINEKAISKFLINDYYSAFEKALSLFEIPHDDLGKITNIDDVVLQKIDEMTPMLDDYIQFLEVVFSYSVEFDIDRFQSFLERIAAFFKPKIDEGHPDTFGGLRNDQYKFFFYEWALYTTAIMTEKERYTELAAFCQDAIIFHDDSSKQVQTLSFVVWQNYVSSLDKFRNKRLQGNRVSVTADIIKNRADIRKYPFNKLMEADVLLYYISLLKATKAADYYEYWWPMTTVYRSAGLPFLQRLISVRFFEKVKIILGISDVNELKNKVEKIKSMKLDRMDRFYYRFPSIQTVFDFSKIATIK